MANALVKDGAVIGFEVVSGGSGYSSPPTVSVPGYQAAVGVTLAFGGEFARNGAVSALTFTP